MKTVSITKVSVVFECLDCKKYVHYTLQEIIDGISPPICEKCDEYMETMECEIDTL